MILEELTNMKVIYLDLDGVLADFDLGVKMLSGKFPHEFGNDDEMWNAVDEKQDFYRHLSLLPQAKEFFIAVRALAVKNGYGLQILTAIPRKKTMPTAEHDKRAWVREHFGSIPVVIGPYSRDKWKHAKVGDILIDDRKSNIDQWETLPNDQCFGILFKNNEQAIADLEKLMDGQHAD